MGEKPPGEEEIKRSNPFLYQCNHRLQPNHQSYENSISAFHQIMLVLVIIILNVINLIQPTFVSARCCTESLNVASTAVSVSAKSERMCSVNGTNNCFRPSSETKSKCIQVKQTIIIIKHFAINSR